MKYLAVLIFVTFLITSTPCGQNSISKADTIEAKLSNETGSLLKVELGIGDEIWEMFTNDGASSSLGYRYFDAIPVPINLHLVGGIRFFEKYRLDYRFGIFSVNSDFLGFEQGLFLHVGIPQSDYYGTVGIDFINNGRVKGGEMTYTEYSLKTTFYCLGGGVNLSKHFNLDLMYFIPQNRVVAYDVDKFTNLRSDYKVYGSIVLGIQYNFAINILDQ